MNGKASKNNFLIIENPLISTCDLIAKIACHFVANQQFSVVIFAKKKQSQSEISEAFKKLTYDERNKIVFMYPKTYDVMLEKLLEMDSFQNYPRVIIIESLQQWRDNIFLYRMHSIYSTIIAALHDLINVYTRTVGNCYSFISVDPDIPDAIANCFFVQNPPFGADDEKRIEEILNKKPSEIEKFLGGSRSHGMDSLVHK